MHGLGERELFLQAALHERPRFRKSTIDRLIHGGKWEPKKQFTALVMHGDAKLSALRFVVSHHFSRDTIAMRHGRAVVQQFGTGSILYPAGTVAQIKEIARHDPSSVFTRPHRLCVAPAPCAHSARFHALSDPPPLRRSSAPGPALIRTCSSATLSERSHFAAAPYRRPMEYFSQ